MASFLLLYQIPEKRQIKGQGLLWFMDMAPHGSASTRGLHPGRNRVRKCLDPFYIWFSVGPWLIEQCCLHSGCLFAPYLQLCVCPLISPLMCPPRCMQRCCVLGNSYHIYHYLYLVFSLKLLSRKCLPFLFNMKLMTTISVLVLSLSVVTSVIV